MKGISAGGSGKMVKTLTALQGNVSRIQKEIESAVFVGEAGGGILKISINGKGEAGMVTINPELLKESPNMVADVITAAINDAYRKKDVFSKEKLKGVASGLLPFGFAIPGMG